MKAVIMAGGEGTRLRPLTMGQPKPMLPVVNRPMAEHVITLLKGHGFDEIVITVAFMANVIRTYFGDGSDFGVHISYATEETPLGTAGSVLNAKDELRERFLVISGDVVTDVDLGALVEFHDKQGATATLALKAMENPLEFGIVITNDEGRIERFLEKPSWGQVFSDTVNTGIYVLEPEVLEHVPEGRESDFSSEVFPALLEAGRPLYGFVTDRYWEDVGTLEAYLKAHEHILDGRVALDIGGFPLRPGVHVGEGTEIDPAAVVEGPAVIGANCRIGPGARLGAYTVLGSNVHVADGADLERCVVHDGCYIGPGTYARASIVGRANELRRGVHLDEGVVLGDHCRIGHQAHLTSGVRIYPHKTVEARATVNSSIIWEARGSRSLFGRVGLTGLPNVDLSPELAVRVAQAYASGLPKGSIVTTSRDSSRAARVLKRAVMVGLNSAGVNVEDLEAATMPVTRFHIASGQSRGGVAVQLSADDPRSVTIRFLDEHGRDLDGNTQRKIERLVSREEARRVLAPEIGDIDFPPRTAELYANALVDDVDLEAVRGCRFKLVLDYAFGASSFVMPMVLARLGAEVLAVNPMLSTVGVLGYERAAHAARIADLVRSSGAHLGAVIGPDGEQLTIIDDTGRVLSDDEALLALATLVIGRHKQATIAVPVNASWRLNEVCADLGAEVAWAKLGGANLMDLASSGEVSFAANTEGGFVFPEFLPAYDAIATLVRLLAMLAIDQVPLSSVVRDLPAVHIVHELVATPFDQKGAVMRSVLERARSDELILLDGVKSVDATGWTLVVPDPDEPFTHVFAEGDSETASSERARRAVEEIEDILSTADRS